MAIAREKVWAIGFIPLILITGIFGAYVFLASPVSSSSQQTAVSNTTSGLELRVSINGTSLHVGQKLNITVSLFNILSSMYNVSFPLRSMHDDFLVQGLPIAMWGGCLSREPVEFMIVKGIYSLAQLEQMSTNASYAGIACV